MSSFSGKIIVRSGTLAFTASLFVPEALFEVSSSSADPAANKFLVLF